MHGLNSHILYSLYMYSLQAPFRLGGATESDRAKVLHGSYKFGSAWKSLPKAQNVVKHLLVVNPRKRWTAEE